MLTKDMQYIKQNDIKLLQLLPDVYLLHAIYNTLVISGIV